MKKSVCHVQLVNGDDIFGVVEKKIDKIRIYNPMQAAESIDEDGMSSLSLVSYLPFSKERWCDIDTTKVITSTETDATFTNFYYLSGYFANKMDEIRNISIDESSDRMAHAIMDDTVQEKSETGHLAKGTYSKH